MADNEMPQELTSGSEHRHKVGCVVVVDVTGRDRLVTLTGVLHSTRDIYGSGGELERTFLLVGKDRINLDWRHSVATIDPHEAASAHEKITLNLPRNAAESAVHITKVR